MAIGPGGSFVDMSALEAGLPVGEGELLGEGYVVRRAARSETEPGLLVELEDASGARVQLACQFERRMPERLMAFGGVAFAVLGEVDHPTAERLRRLAPTLAGVRSALVLPKVLLPLMKPWSQTLDQVPGRLKVSDRCDEACAFCSSPRTDYGPGAAMPPHVEVESRIRRWAKEGVRTLEFVDREPTLNPRLVEYIALAKTCGYEVVRLNSNGFSLAQPGRLAGYVEAGLTELCVSLHAADAALSDRITCRPDGFAAKLQALRLASALPIKVLVNMVVTSENVGEIARVAQLLSELPDARTGRRLWFALSLVGPIGSGATTPELLPPYAELTRALDAALDAHPDIALHPAFGPPPCRLSPRHRRRHGVRQGELTEDRTFLESCAACSMRDRCPGIWRAYLERYGDDGFVPCA